LKELNDQFVAHQAERDAFWDSYQSSQKDSSGFQALKARKATLDIERAQLESELAELVKIGQRVRSYFKASFSHNILKVMRRQAI